MIGPAIGADPTTGRIGATYASGVWEGGEIGGALIIEDDKPPIDRDRHFYRPLLRMLLVYTIHHSIKLLSVVKYYFFRPRKLFS